MGLSSLVNLTQDAPNPTQNGLGISGPGAVQNSSPGWSKCKWTGCNSKPSPIDPGMDGSGTQASRSFMGEDPFGVDWANARLGHALGIRCMFHSAQGEWVTKVAS